MSEKITFEQRCKTMQQCLPDAPYRGMLTVLHIEMLAELKRLLAIEAEWAARSQDDGKAQGEIDRLRAALESEAIGHQAELAGYEHTIGHLSAMVDELRVQAYEHQLTMQQAHDALVAATPVKNLDVQTQVDAVLALRKALEASTQPVANPVEIDGIKPPESGGINTGGAA
jgi:chromosome segregation ATPase